MTTALLIFHYLEFPQRAGVAAAADIRVAVACVGYALFVETYVLAAGTLDGADLAGQLA